MKISFRVDSSHDIGSGHVYRSLTLARALIQRGHQVDFVCKTLPGNIISKIIDEGYHVHIITPQEIPVSSLEWNTHAWWLCSTLEDDIKKTIGALQQQCPDLVITDHYALEAEWESALRLALGVPVAVLDDLCDRPHESALIVDSTYGRTAKDYSALVNKDCLCLTGSQYAQIRDEFISLRSAALNKRKYVTHPKKILVTLGGVDKNNISENILHFLINFSFFDNNNISLIIGGANPHKERLINYCDSQGIRWDFNVTNMAEYMYQHDVAIGALGTTTWERCVLALPTLNLCIAENQDMIAPAVRKSGMPILKHNEITFPALEKNMVSILNNYNQQALIASHVCDGYGTNRITQAVEKLQ